MADYLSSKISNKLIKFIGAHTATLESTSHETIALSIQPCTGVSPYFKLTKIKLIPLITILTCSVTVSSYEVELVT